MKLNNRQLVDKYVADTTPSAAPPPSYRIWCGEYRYDNYLLYIA